MTIQIGVLKISSATSVQIDLIVILTIEKSLAFLQIITSRKTHCDENKRPKGLICHFLLRVRTCHGVIFPLTTLPPVKDEQILNSQVL